MRAAASLAVVLALAGTAAAQPGMTAPFEQPPPQQPAPQQDQVDENVALGLSLGGTVASWALVLAASSMDNGSGGSAQALGTAGALGTLFAPSFGHWYAHSYGTRGLALRGAGVGAAFIGALVAFSECPIFSGDQCHESGIGPALLIAGAGLYLGGTIDDIVTAPGTARRYNHRFENISIVPVLRRDSDGVAVMGRF